MVQVLRLYINIIRQENAWLMNVPNGIPQRFAIAIPETILATAEFSLPLSAILLATIAPTPKNAPCGSPAINLTKQNNE